MVAFCQVHEGTEMAQQILTYIFVCPKTHTVNAQSLDREFIFWFKLSTGVVTLTVSQFSNTMVT